MIVLHSIPRSFYPLAYIGLYKTSPNLTQPNLIDAPETKINNNQEQMIKPYTYVVYYYR